MSRLNEDVENEQKTIVSKRPSGRDSDAEEASQDLKSPQSSGVNNDDSKSKYSFENSAVSENDGIGANEILVQRVSDERQEPLSFTNVTADHSLDTLIDRTETLDISSEIVNEALGALESITSVSSTSQRVEASRSRVENFPSTSFMDPMNRGSEAVSTLGPLPDNFGSARTQNHPLDRTQPPSYTSVEIRRPSIPFIPPAPPPSYGEVMGIESLRSPRPPPLILNVAPSAWTHRSQAAYCRHCHAVVISKIRHIPCSFTHLAAVLLFLFMCWPFCFVPYCVNYCQETRHHCPGCDQLLGSYSPTV